MEAYCSHLKNIIIKEVGEEMPLKGLKIAVDAGNGAGGFYAKDILEPLGADISSSQFLEPDGSFPNHMPNPENKQAMESISYATISTGSDLGLIFDTDVDRSSAVDNRGREISRNGIIALAAALISEEHPTTTIVTDSVTSDELATFLENDLGLKHLRYKRGYKNVINKSIQLNQEGVDSQLAIETSGHAAFKENFFLDDGAYLATKIVIKVAQLAKEGKNIDSLISSLKNPLESKEIRLPITCDDFSSYGEEILEALKIWVKEQKNMSLVLPNYEGVRINFPNGWCLLRKSLHDPIMPLNIESSTENGVENIKKITKDFLKNYSCLDISKL